MPALNTYSVAFERNWQFKSAPRVIEAMKRQIDMLAVEPTGCLRALTPYFARAAIVAGAPGGRV